MPSQIERHGGTVLGSSRAELHDWKIDVERGTAECTEGRFRQLYPTAKRVDVKPIAAKVCDAVREGSTSNSQLVKNGILVWKGDDKISIRHSELIPGEGFQQTVAGRRRRFRDELTRRMKEIGWEFVDVKRTMEFRKMV